MLVLVTGGPQPTMNLGVHVTRAVLVEGGLLLEVARSRDDKPPERGRYHPYVVLFFERAAFPGIRGCIESNGAPWHGTIHDPFEWP